MDDQQKDDTKDIKLNDLERSAFIVSVTIFVFLIVYWTAQIETTYELLAMAYEW